mmetsp:Transcript_100519/g.262022  ORF Transcript_100519/g.262022 Transcript_100519/m.262022 type:complete len:443 (-) Transcript_100519:1303-2631(-)
MAKMREIATTVFCPPESWAIERNEVFCPVNEISTFTPLVEPGCTSSSGWSWGPSMRSLPTPPWTRSEKMSLKCPFTCSSVCRRVCSFCSSTLLIRASMASLDSSISCLFASSSLNWSVKVVNWSMAFLLTCSNLLSSLFAAVSCLINAPWSRALYFAISEDTTVRLRSFSSASSFLFTSPLVFTTTSSSRAASWSTSSWACCSSAASLSQSPFLRPSAWSFSPSLCVALLSSAFTSSCSRSRRSRCFWSSCTRSAWSAWELLIRSASSSFSRLRRKSWTCCSRPLSSRSRPRHLSSLAWTCVSSCFSWSTISCSLASSWGVRSERVVVVISASRASMAASLSAIWATTSFLRSLCRRAASWYLATWPSASCAASAERAIWDLRSPRSSCSWRRSSCRASSSIAVAEALDSTSCSLGFISSSAARASFALPESARRTNLLGSW